MTDDLLMLYDTQLREAAEVADADEVTRIGPLVAATFVGRRRGFVTYKTIPDGTDPAALVAAAVNHYAADPRVDEFEWKTRGHDHVPGLADALAQHQLALGQPETVMAGPVEAAIAAAEPVPSGYVVERAETPDAVREAAALAGRVFGDSPERSARLADALVHRLVDEPGTFEMWLVRGLDSRVVCSGRVEFVPGTDFAGLWGGACDADHRGRGLYRAITAERARSAVARGHRFLQSDCTEFSRPILERAGLLPITTTTPAVWHRPPA